MSDASPPPTATAASVAANAAEASATSSATSSGASVAGSAAGALGSADGATARAAGRGGMAIAGAKVSFLLFGFAQQVLLPHLVGVAGYGAVSRVLAIVGVVNNVVVAASIQGVSRAVAGAAPGDEDRVLGRVLRVHLAAAVAISSAFALLSEWVSSALGATHIAGPLRVAALVVLLYGAYAPLVGSLNGRRRFVAQASLDIGYGALRTVGIAAGAYLGLRLAGDGVMGAIVGFVAAAAAIVPPAMATAGVGRSGSVGLAIPAYLGGLSGIAAGQLCLNGLLQADFLLLSRFLDDGAAAAGLGAGAIAAKDTLVGVYRGVQLFSFLPYQILMAVTFVLFPLLAGARARGDREAIRTYVRTGLRLALLVAGLMVSAIAGLAPHVLRFAFPAVIAEHGAAPLRLLSLGMGCFAIFGTTTAALVSLGRTWLAALLTAGTLALVILACRLHVPGPFGPDMLLRSATATTIALAGAALVGAASLWRVAGGVVSPLTALRVIGALASCLALGALLTGWQLVDPSARPLAFRALVLAEVVVQAAAYLAFLLATRELGAGDLALVRRALAGPGRPRAGGGDA